MREGEGGGEVSEKLHFLHPFELTLSFFFFFLITTVGLFVRVSRRDEKEEKKKRRKKKKTVNKVGGNENSTKSTLWTLRIKDGVVRRVVLFFIIITIIAISFRSFKFTCAVKEIMERATP